MKMANDLIYQKMKGLKRPYSFNDIMSSIDKDLSKSKIQKALEELIRDGKIFQKVYGKQKIYCAALENADPQVLMKEEKEFVERAKRLEEEMGELEKEVRLKESKLATLKSRMSLEQTMKEGQMIDQRIKAKTQKLDELIDSSGSGSGSNLMELQRMSKENFHKYRREYQKHKRCCTELLDTILENYPASKQELYEEIQIVSKTVQ